MSPSIVPRRLRATFPWLLTMAASWAMTAPAGAEPDWGALGYTLVKDMQVVNADGSGEWTVPSPPPTYEQAYKLYGIVLNNPEDMLDGTPNDSLTGMWQLGGQWQVFVQTALPGDFGGAALWMGQNYGNTSFHWDFGSGQPDPAWSYTDSEWLAEIARVTTGGALRAGDLVEIRARGGMFHAGKQNVNEQHSNEPNLDFDVVILGHVGLPAPTTISLGGGSGIKNPDDSFRFGQDRTLATNPEHYQGTLVELLGVHLLDAAGWGNDGTVTLVDAGGLTLPLKLGLNGFDAMPAPSGTFDVMGIFDQDGSNTGDYRLWATDTSRLRAADVPVPEPGSLVLAVLSSGALMAWGTWKRRGART